MNTEKYDAHGFSNIKMSALFKVVYKFNMFPVKSR